MTAPPSSDRARRGARRAVLPVALCAALATVLAACGDDPDAGTNGVGKLSAAEIEHKAQAAADAAPAVRLSGALVTEKETYKLDMRLKKNGGSGSVTLKNNTTIELLRVADTLYLKAGAGFWSHGSGKESAAPSTSDTEAAGKLEDKYVKVPEDDPSYKQLRGFTDMNVLLDGVLALGGDLSKGDRAKVGGVRTIKVAAGKGAGGTLDVSLEGTPYPLQISRAGGAGTLKLTDWGKDFALAAPAQDQTLDYGSKLPSTSN